MPSATYIFIGYYGGTGGVRGAWVSHCPRIVHPRFFPIPEGMPYFRSPPRSRHGGPTALSFSLSGGLRKRKKGGK